MVGGWWKTPGRLQDHESSIETDFLVVLTASFTAFSLFRLLFFFLVGLQLILSCNHYHKRRTCLKD